jgi:hypothetical protein
MGLFHHCAPAYNRLTLSICQCRRSAPRGTAHDLKCQTCRSSLKTSGSMAFEIEYRLGGTDPHLYRMEKRFEDCEEAAGRRIAANVAELPNLLR